METFTASNGIKFTPCGDRTVRWRSGLHPRLVSDGLREFFQWERDQELGVLRDPAFPGYVARLNYDGSHIRGMKESTWGLSAWYPLDVAASGKADECFSMREFLQRVAPQPPRPWLEAKHGEVWLVTRGGFDDVVKVREKLRETLFEAVYDDGVVYSALSPEITAGRRIWPRGGA